VSRPLQRKVTKLEAAFASPMRIVFEYVYERPELTSKRFIKREVHGKVEFEYWEGPEQHAVKRVTRFGVSVDKPLPRSTPRGSEVS